MLVTKQQLLQIMPNAKARVDLYLNYFNKYMAEFDINTPLRKAHFMAQIAHESGELRYTTELGTVSYFSKYDGRKDLGNTQPGDGYRFRGRGFLQLTGRANYVIYKKYCGFDVVMNPDLIAQPVGATRSACWYYAKFKNLNQYADKDDLNTITKKINGGYNGLAERKKYLQRAKTAFNVAQ